MIKVGIVGGTGYTGAELLRLLALHDQVEISVITSRAAAGKKVSTLFPNLRGMVDLSYSVPDETSLNDCALVFFATPNGTAMTMTPALLESGVKVIDLAADFRFKDASVWEEWYGMQHACPELLDEAVYGLPEFHRDEIRGARLVANPGCYPTAVQLGLAPLIKNRLVTGGLIADCKSGISGAGRSASVGTLFCEVGDSMKAYAAEGHRHQPEIEQGLNRLAGDQQPFLFMPHLIPMIRGIHATLYGNLGKTSGNLQELYENEYANEPFVDVMPPGSHPDTRSVRGGNTCRIAVHVRPELRQVVVLSVIDNLVKGAAGQAVQNMNLMFGFDERAGLQQVALIP